MQPESLFNPDKLKLVHYRMVSGQINSPSDFDLEQIKGFNHSVDLKLAFNFDLKLAKTAMDISLKGITEENQSAGADANFRFEFFFNIENLDELRKGSGKKKPELDPALVMSLASITYSTIRGILLVRLQGTPLQGFMLPVVDVKRLL